MNELKIELSCGRCGLTKVITVNLDEDGVFTIPNKFCPNDLNELSREVLRNFVSVPKPKQKPDDTVGVVEPDGNLIVGKREQIAPKPKPDEPTEDKNRVSNPIPRPTRILEVPKHGANRPKKD